MATGWKYIGNNWYYFYNNGSMATDSRIGDYYVTSSGIMVQNEWIRSNYYDLNGRIDKSVSKASLKGFFEPTYFTKVDDTYFVIDSQSSRVMYSKDYTLPVSEWTTADNDLYYPHSAAGHDGTLLVDDTLNGRWKVYRCKSGNWALTQIINTKSDHPHFTYYDKENDSYYSLGAVNDIIYVLKDNGSKMEIQKQISISEIGGYSRSFSIIGGYM